MLHTRKVREEDEGRGRDEVECLMLTRSGR